MSFYIIFFYLELYVKLIIGIVFNFYIALIEVRMVSEG